MEEKLTIAAYARISTDSEDQQNSYKNQSEYFQKEVEEKGHKFYKLYGDG